MSSPLSLQQKAPALLHLQIDEALIQKALKVAL